MQLLHIRNSTAVSSKFLLLRPFLPEDSQKTGVFIQSTFPKISNRGQLGSCENIVFVTWSGTWQQNHEMRREFMIGEIDNINEVKIMYMNYLT